MKYYFTHLDYELKLIKSKSNNSFSNGCPVGCDHIFASTFRSLSFKKNIFIFKISFCVKTHRVNLIQKLFVRF